MIRQMTYKQYKMHYVKLGLAIISGITRFEWLRLNLAILGKYIFILGASMRRFFFIYIYNDDPHNVK